LLLRFVVWGAVAYLDSNYIRRRRQATTRKVLDFTTSSSYSSYKERGRLSHLTRLEEGGYLDRFYAISPFKPTSQTIKVSDRTIFIEWGTERFSRWKNLGLKYSRGAMILWDFFHYCVKLIEDEEINVIRSNNPFTSAAIAFMCSNLTRTPFCVAIRHDFDMTAKYTKPENLPKVLGSRRLATVVQRLVLSRADRVIPTSENRARYAIRHGAKPERIRLDPFRIDPAQFPQPNPALKKELGIEGKKVVSFVGRLVGKYVTDIIYIASRVRNEREDAVFLIVGDGEERKAMEELSHSLELDDDIMFLGMQQWQKAMHIMLISDIFLGVKGGNTLVEAAIAALPLISYDVDWHSELVRDKDTGYLLAEDDIEGAAEAVIRLLDDPELANRLGQNARKLAIERHSIERVRQMRIRLYEELIRDTR